MKKVSRYDIRGKRVLTKMDKYYLTDMGLGRIRNSGFKLEIGAFSNIPDNYPKYVLSFDKMDFSRDGIIHKNVIDFLLENVN